MASMWMPDGSREVEVIAVDGRTALKVRDPRKAFQPLYSAGIVTPRYVTRKDETGQRVTVLAPATVKELAGMGVDLARLVAERPVIVRTDTPVHPAIVRRKGETAADWNMRRYHEGVGAMLAELTALTRPDMGRAA